MSRFLAPSLVAVVLFSAPAPSRAQYVETAPSAEVPGYGASIALHVSAAISSLIGTAGVGVGLLGGLGCGLGGIAGGSSDCSLWGILGVTGGALLSIGLALGISASAVHAHVRSRRAEAGLVVRPSLWVDPTGAGAGLALTF